MSLINTKVQPFKTQAFHNGQFEEVTDKNFSNGKQWSVVIFMPAAFTFNCPTEIEDAADNYADFQKANAAACASGSATCRIHVALHGCKQNASAFWHQAEFPTKSLGQP